MNAEELARHTESIVLDWEMVDLIHRCKKEADRQQEIRVWLRRQQVSFNELAVRLLSDEVGRTIACFGVPALELLSLIRYDTSRVGQEFHRKFLAQMGDEPRAAIVDMWVKEVSGKAFPNAQVRSAVNYLKARPFPPPTPEPVVSGTVVNREGLVAVWLSLDNPAAQRYHGHLRGCSCFWDAMVVIYRWHMAGHLLLPHEHALAVVTALAQKFCSKFMRHELDETSVKRLVTVFMGSVHPDKTGLPAGPGLLAAISDWLVQMEYPDWAIVSNRMMATIGQQRRAGATTEKPEEPEVDDVFPSGNDLKALAEDFALQHIVPGMIVRPIGMIARYRTYLSPVLDHAKYRTWFGRYLRQNGYLRHVGDEPKSSEFEYLEDWAVKFRAWVTNPHVARTYGEWFASCERLFEVHQVDITGVHSAKPYLLVNYLYDQKKVPFKGHVWFTDGKPATCAADETSDTISTKAEKTMALNITTTVALNGTPIQSLTTAQVAERIATEERELAQLEALQNKPNRVKKDIEDRRAKLAQLVAVLDAADEADTPKAAAE